MCSHDNFRVSFRDEMDALREAFREGDAFDIEVYKNVRRENRHEEYHENELDFHRDSRTKLADESKSINYDNEEGGIRHE